VYVNKYIFYIKLYINKSKKKLKVLENNFTFDFYNSWEAIFDATPSVEIYSRMLLWCQKNRKIIFLNCICLRALFKKICEFLCKIMLSQRVHLHVRVYKFVCAEFIESASWFFTGDSARGHRMQKEFHSRNKVKIARTWTERGRASIYV